MHRGEALAAVVVGLVVMTTGLVILFGAWPLVAVGAGIVVAALFLVDLADSSEPADTGEGGAP